MAPISNSLISDEPGMGGFSYKELYKNCGNQIDYFNVQCYDEYTLEILEQMINNGYPIEKLVMCHIFGQNINDIIYENIRINKKYNDFLGVSIWEYYGAPPGAPDNPEVWCIIMDNLK